MAQLRSATTLPRTLDASRAGVVSRAREDLDMFRQAVKYHNLGAADDSPDRAPDAERAAADPEADRPAGPAFARIEDPEIQERNRYRDYHRQLLASSRELNRAPEPVGLADHVGHFWNRRPDPEKLKQTRRRSKARRAGRVGFDLALKPVHYQPTTPTELPIMATYVAHMGAFGQNRPRQGFVLENRVLAYDEDPEQPADDPPADGEDQAEIERINQEAHLRIATGDAADEGKQTGTIERGASLRARAPARKPAVRAATSSVGGTPAPDSILDKMTPTTISLLVLGLTAITAVTSLVAVGAVRRRAVQRSAPDFV